MVRFFYDLESGADDDDSMFLRVLAAVVVLMASGLIVPSTSLAAVAQPPSFESSVVQVCSSFEHGTQTCGGGVLVGEDQGHVLVLTALHVAGGDELTVEDRDETLDATVLRRYGSRDLVLLRSVDLPFRMRDLAFATLAKDAIPQSVWVVPSSSGLRAVRSGFRSWNQNYPGAQGRGPFALIDCSTCDSGDSGSGVFADDGSLVAILVARVTRHVDGAFVTIVAERVDSSLFK